MCAADAGGTTDARAPVVSPASADWKALGTMVQLIVTDPGRLADGRRLLEADLAAVDAACSRFRSDSELVALDSVPGPIEVSPLLAQALAVARRACPPGRSTPPWARPWPPSGTTAISRWCQRAGQRSR